MEILVYLSLLIIAPLVGFGIPSFLFLRKRKLSTSKSFIVSLVVGAILSFFSYSLYIDCSSSSYLDNYLKKTLTSKEYDSLKPHGLICPTEYEFVRGSGIVDYVTIIGGFRAKVVFGRG